MLPLILSIVFMSLGAISLVLFLVGKLKGYSVKETLIKSVASLFFIATASVGLYFKGGHILPLFVELGLICGLLGDIWLELKYVFRQEERLFTYAGFVSFTLGHILYITGMFLEFYQGNNVLYTALPLAVGILMGIANLFIAKPLKLDLSGYKMICFIYGSLLFSLFTVTVSLNIMYRFQNVTLIMLLSGAVLFVLSDLILSGTYFGKGKDKPFDLISNAITYYMAQFVIAFSLYFL